MQKRRGRASRDAMKLPLTMSDVSNNANINMSSTYSKNRKGQKKASTMVTCSLFLLSVVILGFLLTTNFDFVSHHPSPDVENKIDAFSNIKGSTLSKFESIKRPLAAANIVGLYFAASWCSMSTPVTESLQHLFTDDEKMRSRVLTSDSESPFSGENADFALVYVSSDESEHAMKEYSKSNWINIPFDSPDKNSLKRHFRTCAEIEMKELGIDVRRFHIPTLIIIDSVSQGILSTNGVDELEEYGEDVLDHWLALQDLTRSLEDKYDEE